ncbi:hypothetical protein PVAND_012681 [Polypedilum vanderplanki]|uniref:Uncharacterized protein n=1 Tax=Polypedilum vanderplanki TaxID=319348 RepID=A0A9J6CN97_POLVA|nr:hypothetical protein PVAND_012681 [Polypedilum vanderplanki]
MLNNLQLFDKFPKAIYYILCNTFLERFTSGGLFAILALYLNQNLLYDQDASTALYHICDFILHLATIFSAILADSWLGLYKTLFIMSITFCMGCATLFFAAVGISLDFTRILSIIALMAISIGAGSCRCNLNVFGANQFKNENLSSIDFFYTVQFCILKFGHVLGMISFPLFRESFGCFSKVNCYSFVFAIAAVIMALSTYVLWKGKENYIYDIPRGNVFVKFCRCIFYALKRKYQDNCMLPRNHWLEHAEIKFGSRFISESKGVLNIIVMFMPLPIFWALVQQQSSRWVFQASKMDGDFGWIRIKPDQLIAFIPMFIVILVPIFDRILFPILAKISIKSPLQKMTCGMICAGFSFLISAYLEVMISQQQVSMLWLFPQYLLIAASEVLVWLASLAFAYTQACSSMKSIINSFVYLTVAGGNLIVFFISAANLFDSQLYEFLFFAFLMFLDTGVFIMLSIKYKYIEIDVVNNNNCDNNDNYVNKIDV